MSGVWTIYKATAPDGRAYVGCTRQRVELRWAVHKYRAGRGDLIQVGKLAVAIREFGADAFDFEVLATAGSQEEGLRLEAKFIAELGTFENGLNSSRGGIGPNGMKTGEALRDFRRKLLTGRQHREDTREKMSKSMRGLKRKAAFRETMREVALARMPMSDETRRKMSESAKKRAPHSEETRRKIAEANRRRASNREVS